MSIAKHVNPRLLVRNTLWMLMGEGTKLVLQAVYFVCIARSLGADRYGAFVAVTAAATLAAPFIGTGSGKLMVQAAALDHSRLPEFWGRALTNTTASALSFYAVLVFACAALMPKSIPMPVICFLLCAELMCAPYATVAGMAFQAVEDLRSMANLNILPNATRLTGIVVLILLHRTNLMDWSIAYLAASFLAAFGSLAVATRRFGWPRLNFKNSRREIIEGFYFSAGLSAQTIYNDIDKTMLARLGTLDAAGIYAAAYRLIDVSFVPVKSLLAAAYPAFFRSGQGGMTDSLEFARRLVKKPLLYSVAISGAMLVAAPVVPLILGAQYARTADALRWLSVLPILKTLHYFAADSLTGAGLQGLRTLVQTVIAVFNVLLNLWIIPRYSWRGAAWSSLASDGLLAVILWSCALLLSARQRSRKATEIEMCGLPETEGVSL